MQKLFVLDTNNTSFKKDEFLSSSYNLIPLDSSINDNLRIGSKVLKGEFVTDNNYSYVSGIIKGINYCHCLDEKRKALVISNNFKEQRSRKKLDGEEIIPKYLANVLKEEKENLIFYISHDEPLIFNNHVIANDFYRDLLNTLDFIRKTHEYSNIYIVAKDNDNKIIEKFTRVIGNYPEIKLITIPNIYPVKNTNYFSNNLNINNYTILDINDIYNIYYIKKYGFNKCEKYITINVQDKKPIVINVKLGALVVEILNYLKINYQNYNIYLNGLIGGIKVDNITDLIVDDKLDAIFFTKEEICESKECINCGICEKYCPARINPKYIMNSKKTISEDYLNKCINCGLCNFICPVYINLQSYIERRKHETTQQ